MQLSILRLAPLLALHAVICLLHLQSRPTLAWWANNLSSSSQALAPMLERVQFPQFWQPIQHNR